MSESQGVQLSEEAEMAKNIITDSLQKKGEVTKEIHDICKKIEVEMDQTILKSKEFVNGIILDEIQISEVERQEIISMINKFENENLQS